MFINSLIN